MKTTRTRIQLIIVSASFLFITSCGQQQQNQEQVQAPEPEGQTAELDLLRGELALCGVADFGTTNFGLTCMKEIREEFKLAIALLHSFEYAESEKAFARVIDADPECAIAYWGVAMSNYHPLWSPPKKHELEKSAKAIEHAKKLPTKTEREARYIEAISMYYKDWDQFDHKTRAKQYVDAMEKLYTDHPDDTEAAIFYALALNSIVDPKDKNFTNQHKAGEILNKIFPDEPDHPGIAHYIIHSYDYPELAHLALNSARRYANIAPSSAHAQHMPSHIFTRLGLWEESIVSNLQSAESAVCYTENLGETGHWFNELHALDYLMYAYLQSSQLLQAKELLEYTEGIEEVYPQNFVQAYSLAAIPARYALERRDWEAASNTPQLLESFPWEDYPWEASIINFAKALGSVHVGDLENAKNELGALKANHDKLLEKEDTYKANQVSIQLKTTKAWINYVEGNTEQGLTLMAKAADLEDGTAKHPVTPGEVLPARELLGDMFMQSEKYREALEAYQLSLEKHQKRFNSIFGAGSAAEQAGALDQALQYFNQLIEITTKANGTRAELDYAKQYIENNTSKQLSLN